MISFVYFDLGGVVSLDFSGTNKFQQLQHDIGVYKKNQHLFEQVWKRYHDRVCIDCDVDSLIPILEKEVGLHFPKHYSLLQDFVNRFEPNPSMLQLIMKVKKHHKVGLLTNMYPRMFNAMKKRGLIPDIVWDVIVDSSIVGYQKPDKRIFDFAEHMAHTPSKEIFYIDNSLEHVHVAQKLKWNTFLYDPTHPDISTHQLEKTFMDHMIL